MANTLKLKIDNRDVTVPEGTNLIDAAEAAGVHIPNLCHMKGMKGIGACRLCMVEIEGLKAPLTACTTKAKEGMTVKTVTPQLIESRKFVIDLILSMHPLDCMTCTKAGVCMLQKYAYDLGIKESSFTRKKFGYAPDEANPFIKRDPEYCILCGKCVRVCKNQGTDVLEFMGRGVGSKATTANEKPLQESGCTFCGSCIDACPVNAILEADRWRKGREWDYEAVDSVCMLCGNGCDIAIYKKDGHIVKINAASPDKYICAYGRFGFDSIEADTRVSSPMKRVGSELKETTWQDAINIVAQKLKTAGSSTGFISSAGIMNEDAFVLKQFAATLNSKNIDTTASLYSDPDSLINESADINAADLIFLVGLAPSQRKRVLPALDAYARSRANSGVKLIVINAGETNIASVAALSLKGDEAKILSEITQGIISKGAKAPKELVQALTSVSPSDDAIKAAELFIAANNPLIICSPALYDASANLSQIKGSVIAVPLESNAKGMALLGIKGNGKSYKEMTDNGMKMLYAVGELPLDKRPETEFLIVQNSHLTELAKQADVVLPSTGFYEASGTMIDYSGKLKHLHKAVEPAGQAKSHREIFIALSEAALGKTITELKDTDINKALNTKPKTAVKPFKKKHGFDVNPEEIIESINHSVINSSRLLWLKESEKTMAKV